MALCRVCDSAALAARDPKGLYKKAMAGEIKGLVPAADTATEYSEEEEEEIKKRLKDLGYI